MKALVRCWAVDVAHDGRHEIRVFDTEEAARHYADSCRSVRGKVEWWEL